MSRERTYDERSHQEYDEPEVIIIGKRSALARKTHKCAHCGQPITAGTQYIRFAYLDHRDRFHCDRAHYICPMEENWP